MASFRLLIDAIPEKTFYLHNGKPIRNLQELISELESISQDEFSHHCNHDKDDFALWIEDALLMSGLANILRTIKDKKEYIETIRLGKRPDQNSNASSESNNNTAYDSVDTPVGYQDENVDDSESDDDSDTTTKNKHNKHSSNHSKKSTNKTASHSNSHSKNVKSSSDSKKKISTNDVIMPDNSAYNLNTANTAIAHDVAQMQSIIHKVYDENSALDSKMDAMKQINSEFTKMFTTLTKSTIELKNRLDDTTKMNSELLSKISSLELSNEELKNRTNSLIKTASENKLPDMVSESVKGYFENKEFKNELVGMFKQMIIDINSKYQATLKSELNSIAALNSQLDKKLEISIQNRDKQTEKIAQLHVTELLSTKLSEINSKVDSMIESRTSRIEKSFDKRLDAIHSQKVAKFRDHVKVEKQDLRDTASDVMHREFEKIFNNDEHISALVSKYRKLFTEGMEHSTTVHKEFQAKFKDELKVLKDDLVVEAKNALNTQMASTIKHQREIFDAELAKALNSNKYFVSRFEKEILDKERVLLASADRTLKENYAKHDGMLNSEFKKYSTELNDVKLALEKDFKTREDQLTASIALRIHESINKEFNDIVLNQRKELSNSISTVRVNAINKIELEFGEILSKHKHFIIDEFSKAASEQNALKDKFVSELKAEELKMLTNVKELLQKELSSTLKDQRQVLDTELSKTVLANKYFVERFEKEIMEMNKKYVIDANKVLSENYAKHDKAITASYNKQISTVNKMITDADSSIDAKESKALVSLNSIIPSSVREAVNKEFSRLIVDEKNALDVELKKAQATNIAIEHKFESELTQKANKMMDLFTKEFNKKFAELMMSQQAKLDAELSKATKSYTDIESRKNEILAKTDSLIKDVNNTANAKLGELVASHQAKMDSELVKAKKAFDAMESKKNEMIAKTNSFLDDMTEYSADKLKELEREHDKHIDKVSQISSLINKVEKGLDDLKSLKAEVNNDKKTVTKENKEYSELMTELNDLKENLSKEKNWIAVYREKVNIYNMIRECSEYIRLNDGHNAKTVYNKIAKSYSQTPFEGNDKIEVYNAAALLLKELQKAFPDAKAR